MFANRPRSIADDGRRGGEGGWGVGRLRVAIATEKSMQRERGLSTIGAGRRLCERRCVLEPASECQYRYDWPRTLRSEERDVEKDHFFLSPRAREKSPSACAEMLRSWIRARIGSRDDNNTGARDHVLARFPTLFIFPITLQTTQCRRLSIESHCRGVKFHNSRHLFSIELRASGTFVLLD